MRPTSRSRSQTSMLIQSRACFAVSKASASLSAPSQSAEMIRLAPSKQKIL